MGPEARRHGAGATSVEWLVGRPADHHSGLRRDGASELQSDAQLESRRLVDLVGVPEARLTRVVHVVLTAVLQVQPVSWCSVIFEVVGARLTGRFQAHLG
eukprot:5685192-Prymnesium_polylepis.2